MTTTNPTPDRGRYVIYSTNPPALLAFIKTAKDDPAIELNETIGPADHPHTVVATMPAAKAADLALHFQGADHLKIEPDRPLSLFGR